MPKAPASPFSQWRLLLACNDEKTAQTLERLFDGRVADIERVDNGGAARSRIGDSFGRPIRLALIDEALITEKEIAGWVTSLKNNLARPNIIVLGSNDSKHATKLADNLGALGVIDPQLAAGDFIRALLKLAAGK